MDENTNTLMTSAASNPPGGENPPGGNDGEGASAGDGQQAEQPGQHQQQADGQPQASSKTEGDGQKQEKAAGAPEKYEFAPPEGTNLDEAVVASFSEVAKELDLPQDKAQKVIDKVAPMLAKRQTERLAEANAGWVEASKADKEFGGDDLEKNLAVATSALNAFATPEFKKLLVETGLGNHPEVIRTFYRAGKRISEAGYAGGKGKGQVSQASPQQLYSNSNMNP
jgi:hypothetical protein